ncbi:hypothetical protein [Streptomyces anandii]|uniref:hypothetical protein n=1 Tax=Streptomyces anandii TaxID=285454 RepID=UPI0037A79899
MLTSTLSSSTDRIRAHYAHLNALHGPTVIAEASSLLDALLDTAERQGYDRDGEALGWLVTAAAETAASRYDRPTTDRTAADLAEMRAALRAAFNERGLTVTDCRAPMGIAVERTPGGPGWGTGGKAGLAVTLWTNTTWELTINAARARAFPVVAPVTEDGARDVAALVRDIATGKAADPFRTAR